MQTRIFSTLTTLLLFMAIPLGTATDLSGGGTITNVLPLIPTASFSNEEGITARTDVKDVITGLALDPNGEQDLARIRITITYDGVQTVQVETAVNASALPTEQPLGYTLGWKVWNPVDTPGAVKFAFRYQYTAPGVYTITADASEAATGTVFGAASQLQVSVNRALAIGAHPLDEHGVEQEGRPWGDWSAKPGDTNVASNFLKITNTGDVATQQLTVSFTPQDFLGDDLLTTIKLVGNLQFRCGEKTSVATTPAQVFPDPDAGWEDDFGGAHTCAFTAMGNQMFVQYRIKEIPMPLKAQDYDAGYTISDDIA